MLKEIIAAPLAIALLLGILLVFAFLGAMSTAVLATVVAGAGYLLGLISLATAKALWLGLLCVGAIIGVLSGIAQLVMIQ